MGFPLVTYYLTKNIISTAEDYRCLTITPSSHTYTVNNLVINYYRIRNVYNSTESVITRTTFGKELVVNLYDVGTKFYDFVIKVTAWYIILYQNS